MANYYEILEVSENASIEVIDKAYRVLAKKYHPDVYQGDKKQAEAMMKQLNEAYDVLSDESKRANYDAILKRKKQLELNKDLERKNNENQNFQSQLRKDTSSSSPLNNPAKYNKDKFVVDTTYMDEKQKRKIKKKLQERYIEAYDDYLRSRGYKLRYKWTPKRILKAVGIVCIIILIFTILFFIPPIHDYFVSLYESNVIIKISVDLISSLVSAIFSTISNLFSSIFG